MLNNINVCYRNVFGKDRVFPVCELALKISELIGTKTFNEWQLKKIQSLGFKITFVAYIPKNQDNNFLWEVK